MVRTEARYDGLAAWYEAIARPSADFSREDLAGLLGDGDGLCLDLGSGTGLYAGIRQAVGVRHRTLAELLNDVLASPLRLLRVEEPRDDPVPAVLALVAARPVSRGDPRPGRAG